MNFYLNTFGSGIAFEWFRSCIMVCEFWPLSSGDTRVELNFEDIDLLNYALTHTKAVYFYVFTFIYLEK